MLHVRPFVSSDRDFLFRLVPRLAIGRQPWREEPRWLAAVEGWLAGSIEQYPHKTMIIVAEDDQGEQLGFATVSHTTHFSGQPQAYIGELATAEHTEGRGVGTALVAACEEWAREQGYALLVLTTGAANARALGFYRSLGFRDEDVTLTKQLG